MLGAVSPATAQTPSPADTSAASSPPASETAAPPADTSSAPPASETAADSVAAPTESARIGDISVEGNARTESSRIVRSFEVPTGSHYSKDALRRGIRKLFTLGLFEDVWLEEMPHGQTVDVLIHVRERPRLGTLTFHGNKKREDSDLEKKMTLHVGDIVTPTIVQTQIDSLLKYYRGEGYAQAKVETAADTNRTDNSVALTFQIQEGEKVKITAIQFRGVSAYDEAKLRKQLKTKRKGFFGGGEIDEDKFKEDREKLEAFFHNNGYRDAHVAGHELIPGDTPKHLTLVVTVDQGPVYRVGSVTWTGNTIVGTDVLRRLWQPHSMERYDQSRIERTQGGAYGEYAERGYLYVNIEPKETVRDSTVDFTFTVTEGQPSNVRLVNVLGNKNTRENVIRREIAIHEGDRFRRSALVRTQGDIFRLGMFEDVQIDFSPADSTDVDINLKVKEKQVGTASAGAGYTGETGVTGFIELSHNNVLGNGQSLSLHLERGGRRSDYYLSFTEPWFRGTPTLLGFSVFNTRTEQDVYEEKRVGGSVRLGRPLPWPDFTRGSVEYRLENVTVNNLVGVGSPSSPINQPYAGFYQNGKPQLTSSLQLFVSRNNMDNPFYPHHGTRLDINEELAGGVFGGSIDFHKTRLEGRAYFPSIVKGFTTMVRGRFGLLGHYAGQTTPVPPYETFRLGGGSTTDPLRGYDDYQVVPGKYNRFVPTIGLRTVVDSVGGVPVDTTVVQDTTGFVRVRYPGGRFMTLYTVEQQFPIVLPLRGVFFFDAGNTWDLWKEIKPFDLRMGAGIGFRMEIPLLGNIGFDYGYGFNRDDGPRAKAHFLLGNINF
jgi:outer membrane protein insertion porin family